nr:MULTISPECIES: FAD-binding and (Fe-S)-binding domain-containing protein [unclassified Nesterenkonia]
MSVKSETAQYLVQELIRAGVSKVDASVLARGMYSSDASLYRVVPTVVVRPQHVDELHAVHEISRSVGAPVTMRGAGTSIAGNAVGEGIVVDTRDLKRIISIDPDAQTATVEPGVVHADLQRAAAPHGLRFGPDPSTHSRCTIGGMIGNNACGSRALGYGRTADNVEAATVLFGNGEVGSFDSRSGTAQGVTAEKLLGLAEGNLAHVRTRFGQFSRQVSGYSFEHLLPENRRRIERFLVGSEGTLATVLEAEVRLVVDDPRRLLLVLGYDSVSEAADAVPHILDAVHSEFGPNSLIACEGMDSRLVALVRSAGKPVPQLPGGQSWLFVEAAGEAASAVIEKVRTASAAVDTRFIESPAEAAALWKIREDGAGLAGISLATPAHSGWEDSAVPPKHLGAWMRDFESLLEEFGLHGYPYGHFGDGCIHCRIDFPFQHGDPSSTGVFREFMLACAERLSVYGGSLSGEHGDGRVRSELLPFMYDETSLDLFAQAKRICDPQNLLNPGIITGPQTDGARAGQPGGTGARPNTEDIRPTRPKQTLPWPGLLMTHDDGDYGAAVHRCSGVGRCVAPKTNGVMCPSYLATTQEKDSTRGRARVLQEAMDGTLVHGLADPAVHEALDLCLSCKGCASDCPAGVDMAAYKAEALHQKYDRDADGLPRRRLRPRSHYVLGRLPVWAKLAAPVAPVANLMMKLTPLAAAAKWVAGIDQRRSVPRFARRTLRRAEQKLSPTNSASPNSTDRPDVWVWADSFTNHFFPQSGLAAIEYLQSQGLEVRLIQKEGCCGLPWISTGQLDQARRRITQAVEVLAPYVSSGVPVIGLEPSCLATLRSDALELSDSEQTRTVAAGVLTFAELLTRLEGEGRVRLPDLNGVDVVAQPHCHQSAIIGWEADRALLEKAGAEITKVAGCCGLAGNFGVEKGHYETSVAVAETYLMPAVRDQQQRGGDTVVLADGMSCRIQLDDLADVPAMHLAELLNARK